MEASGNLYFTLNRVLRAPRDAVWRACTEPDEWAKWWGPEGFTSPSLESDLRVGGSYRILMQPPEGDAFHLTGEFREVDPPTHLAYTFVWEDPDPDDQETLATLTFTDGGDSTELWLQQGPFATEARRELHESGWGDSFDKLQQLITARQSG
jgi:uncharacterized protein YndB with AHSA1/START domain